MFKQWLALVILILFGVNAAAFSGDKRHEGQKCLEAIDHYEHKYDIPKGLLHSIALVESGRWNKDLKQKMAWPWAVNVKGEPYYFQNKLEAVNFVKAKLSKGVTNIDIGCAQISLLHHGHNFPDLETAFEPRHNVNYAAKFLRSKHDEAESWVVAVGWYHSKRPEFYTPYIHKVHKTWRQSGRIVGYSPVANSSLKPIEKKHGARVDLATSVRKRNMRRENSLVFIKD